MRHVMRSAIVGAILAASAGCTASTGDRERAERDDADDQEMVIALDACPPAVRDTIVREAGSGTIGEIDCITDDGITTYEADVVLDGKKWELHVRADGKLSGKEPDGQTDLEDD